MFVKNAQLDYNFAMKKTIVKLIVVMSFILVQNRVHCAVVPVPSMPAQTAQHQIETPEPINTQLQKPTQNTPKQSEKPIKKEQPKKINKVKSEKPVDTISTKRELQNKKDLPAEKKEETKIPEIKPSELNDLREQAKFLYNSNKLDEAQQIYNKISESDKNSDDWLIIANIAQDKGKPIDAVFYLKKAIALDDSNYKAHYNLGNLYYADDKINMALDEYKKVLRLKKDFAYAYYNKGCCYLKKKSWFNARYEFGLAIKANPDEPSFYYNLAYTCKMMKKQKKAQEALEMYNKLMSQ